MNTNKSKENAMNEKSDLHTKREPSFTRRSVVKAGWMIPAILAVGLPPGDLFAQGSNTQGNYTGGNSQVGNNIWDNTQVCNNTPGNTQVVSTKGGSRPVHSINKYRGRSKSPKNGGRPVHSINKYRGRSTF